MVRYGRGIGRPSSREGLQPQNSIDWGAFENSSLRAMLFRSRHCCDAATNCCYCDFGLALSFDGKAVHTWRGCATSINK